MVRAPPTNKKGAHSRRPIGSAAQTAALDKANKSADANQARRAAAGVRAATAALASTLYNRGLLFHQAGDLLSAGGDLRRGLVSSREGLGPLHEYTADAAGALAFVARQVWRPWLHLGIKTWGCTVGWKRESLKVLHWLLTMPASQMWTRRRFSWEPLWRGTSS